MIVPEASKSDAPIGIPSKSLAGTDTTGPITSTFRRLGRFAHTFGPNNLPWEPARAMTQLISAPISKARAAR